MKISIGRFLAAITLFAILFRFCQRLGLDVWEFGKGFYVTTYPVRWFFGASLEVTKRDVLADKATLSEIAGQATGFMLVLVIAVLFFGFCVALAHYAITGKFE